MVTYSRLDGRNTWGYSAFLGLTLIASPAIRGQLRKTARKCHYPGVPDRILEWCADD